MLEELLSLIRTGETLSIQQIAHHLQVSETLVGMMLNDLERMGYLETVSTCAQSSCAGCSVGSRCHADPSGKMWREG